MKRPVPKFTRQGWDAWMTHSLHRWVFPLHEAIKGHQTIPLLRHLDKSQWWDLEHILHWQTRRLNQFLKQIVQVPYYKPIVKGLHFPVSLEGLSQLPFLDKALIRSNQHQLIHPNAKGFQWEKTGGSSGQPLVFGIDKHRISHDVALKLRARSWWGALPGDREWVIWAAPNECQKQSVMHYLRDWVFRSHLINAHGLNPHNTQKLLKDLHTHAPMFLSGYPSLISWLAGQWQTYFPGQRPKGIKTVFLTSEMLEPHQRDIIENQFDCQVANEYGARDAGFMAHQCPKGQLHISSEDIIVEIIDANGNVLAPGHVGEIVVTHLASSGFPMLRYKTGDLASLSLSPCACGRGLPILKGLQGRISDLLYRVDGQVVHRADIVKYLSGVRGIEQFKVIQHSVFHTEVLWVGQTLSEKVQAQIKQAIGSRLGPNVDLQLKHISTLPVSPSGKHRFIVSKVTDPKGEIGECIKS